MKNRLLLFVVLMGLLVPGATMAQDLGPAPDTVALVLTQAPSANAGQDTLEIQLWVYNDDLIKGANMGFAWDNPTFDLVSAEATTLADNAFDLVVAFYENGDLATTNANDRFLFGGSRLFNGMAGDTQRRHWATYRFVTSDWTVNDSIAFDTNAFNSGSQWIFVNANTVGYQAIWEQGEDGSFVVYDPDRPISEGGNIVVDKNTFNFDATVGDSILPTQILNVTSDGDPLTVNLAAAAPWLTIDPVTGGTPLAVTLTVNAGGLAAGSYVDTIDVTSSDADNSPQQVVVNLEVLPQAPVITCIDSPIDTTLAGPTQLCVPLPVANGGSVVSAAGGTWIDGVLCYPINEQTAFTDTVVATNAGGADTCIFSVTVSFGGPPAITCPFAPLAAFECGPSEICVPLPIDGADSATGDFGAIWAGDTLCFQADTSGLYTIEVVAYNQFGNDTCGVAINVDISNEPSIACPLEPITVPELESAGLVCVEIPATDVQDSMVVTPSLGVWTSDTLCFIADTAGTYSFELVGYGSCGVDTCTVDIIVPFALCNTLAIEPSVIQIVDTLDGTPDPIVRTINVTSDNGPACFELIDDAEDWLTLSVDSSCTPSVITLVADPTALPTNVYQAQPTILGDTSTCNYPDTLQFDVVLTVVDTASPADTIRVVNTPAVPGAQVTVPMRIISGCDITQVLTNLEYPTEWLTLDSIMFDNSPFGDTCSQKVEIDNVLGEFSAHYTVCEDASFDTVAAGNNLFAELYFSVAVEAPAGYYPISIQEELGGTALLLNKLCSGTPLQVTPAFVEGGLVVDTSGNYVCGYVVDPDGNPIPHAGVRLYGDYPDGDTIATTIANGQGAWAFSDFTTVPFDLYAHAEGYYPNTVLDVNFGEVGIMIVLQPVGPTHPTPEWVDFYCSSNTFMGRPLPVGSVIEAFDPDGVRCGVAYVSEEGKYGFMPVYRDDAYSAGDQGAEPGDLIRFYINGIEAIASGPRIWTANGDNFEVCLEVGEPQDFTCELTEGWNLISWNLDQTPDNVTTFFAPIEDCLEVVLGFERGGLVYDPALPEFSTLWQVDHLSGYWVKVSCDVSLPVTGVPVPTTTPIPLDQGWNLVSYLPNDTQAVETALASVMDDLLVALGFGTIYVPGDEFNTLTEMSLCNGYWVKVDQPSSLVYGDAGPLANKRRLVGQPLATADDAVAITNRWMNVYSHKLTVDGDFLPSGTEVTAHAGDGTIIGRSAVRSDGSFGFMSVYAGHEQNGLKEGEQFYVSIDGEPTNERFAWTDMGDKLELTALSISGDGAAVPHSFSLAQNYPNPFNPTTTIRFTLPTAVKARLEIYNILGKLVAVPLDGMATAGENTVIWDGRNDSGEQAASGVYFYRLTAGDYSETKKMTLLK